jgi:hypothetical protein
MITGVAIRNRTVLIKLPAPNRHVDCFEHCNKLGISYIKHEIGTKAKDQGFYTHTGKYLDREQAYRYAKRMGQELLDNPNGALCSENLW